MISNEQLNTVIFIGDSYSDTGQLSKRYLFGIVPLGWLGGLDKSSTKCRFTDGYTWVDFFKQKLVKKYYADKKLLEDLYGMTLNGNYLIRTYTEGGMYDSNKNFPATLDISFSSLWKLIKSLPEMISVLKPIASRFILSKLSDMVDLLLKHDKSHKVTPIKKTNSLIIFWTGANDFFTVNACPNATVIKESINAKEHEIKRLIANGYKNFCIFTMANPNLAPRFYNENDEQKKKLVNFTEDYNKSLNELIARLSPTLSPDINITVFDVNKELQQIVDNLSDYDFTPEGLKQVMKGCSKQDQHGKQPGCGTNHVWWDDVHPTQALHSVLYKKFKVHFKENYTYVPINSSAPQMKLI